MMTDIYDWIIFSIVWGFIALPLYFGYVELANREPTWLLDMTIFIISGTLTGLILYWFFNPKKSK